MLMMTIAPWVGVMREEMMIEKTTGEMIGEVREEMKGVVREEMKGVVIEDLMAVMKDVLIEEKMVAVMIDEITGEMMIEEKIVDRLPQCEEKMNALIGAENHLIASLQMQDEMIADAWMIEEEKCLRDVSEI